jgi:hypothetical protein
MFYGKHNPNITASASIAEPGGKELARKMIHGQML